MCLRSDKYKERDTGVSSEWTEWTTRGLRASRKRRKAPQLVLASSKEGRKRNKKRKRKGTLRILSNPEWMTDLMVDLGWTSRTLWLAGALTASNPSDKKQGTPTLFFHSLLIRCNLICLCSPAVITADGAFIKRDLAAFGMMRFSSWLQDARVHT